MIRRMLLSATVLLPLILGQTASAVPSGSPAAQVMERVVYPRSAISRGQEGRVTLSVTLQRSGVVDDVTIEESSGVKSLDRAAVSAVKRVKIFKLRDVDVELFKGGNIVTITIPINFLLGR